MSQEEIAIYQFCHCWCFPPAVTQSPIKEMVYKIDIDTLERKEDDIEPGMNAISKVKIRTTKPLMIVPYRENRTTGSIILVDDGTNETVAAGMMV